MKDIQRNVIEFIETVYKVFYRVDKNITRDMVKQNLSIRELGDLVVAFRMQNNIISNCPHCKKELTYNDIYKQVKENFQKTQSKKDITATKKEN
jgi:hypothetical protein